MKKEKRVTRVEKKEDLEKGKERMHQILLCSERKFREDESEKKG